MKLHVSRHVIHVAYLWYKTVKDNIQGEYSVNVEFQDRFFVIRVKENNSAVEFAKSFGYLNPGIDSANPPAIIGSLTVGGDEK